MHLKAVVGERVAQVQFQLAPGMHARIHAERESGKSADPIAPVAKLIAEEALLLCFDEFQVTDVADAMILGRLFEQLFDRGTVIVATSNTSPDRLYEGGLNRQLFLPFIAMIESKLEVLELDGGVDYRRCRLGRRVVVLGGGGIAVDFAHFASRPGDREVTVVHRGKRVGMHRVRRLGSRGLRRSNPFRPAGVSSHRYD